MAVRALLLFLRTRPLRDRVSVAIHHPFKGLCSKTGSIETSCEPFSTIRDNSTTTIVYGGTVTGFWSYLSTTPPVHCAELIITSVHTMGGLPWWAAIVGVTILLRSLVTLPFAVHHNKILTRIELLQPTIKEINESMKYAIMVRSRREGLSVEEANRKYKKQV